MGDMRCVNEPKSGNPTHRMGGSVYAALKMLMPHRRKLQSGYNAADKFFAAVGFFNKVANVVIGKLILVRSDSVLDIGPANAVKVNVINPDKARMCGQNDVFAGYLILGVAEVDVDAVLPCKRKLGIDMLACAGVFGLLHNDALIFVHFLCCLRVPFQDLRGKREFR